MESLTVIETKDDKKFSLGTNLKIHKAKQMSELQMQFHTPATSFTPLSSQCAVHLNI